MATTELNILKRQSDTLAPSEKLELISYVSKSLALSANGKKSKPLEFAKYRNSGLKRSTAEDFKIAEWHPTEAELNGD